jgi:hypothetical protein
VALGGEEKPEFVSGTRNLYRHILRPVPRESGPAFDIIRDRGSERTRFGNCAVSGFELRIMREASGGLPGVIHLRLDICGETPPQPYPAENVTEVSQPQAERFREPRVRYAINGIENRNIYGLTSSVKEGGTKTEIRIHRVLRPGGELPAVIDSLNITARLYRDHYEWRLPGTFRLTLSNLLLMADETAVNAAGAVMGPLRYYAAGDSTAEVFTTAEEYIL